MGNLGLKEPVLFYDGVELIGHEVEDFIVVNEEKRVLDTDYSMTATFSVESIDMSFFLTLCNTFECLNLVEECQA